MILTEAEYTFRLTKDELSTICFVLKRNLIETIKVHYTKLQQGEDGEPVFHDLEKDKIRMLKFFSQFTGYNIHEDFEGSAKKLFQEARTQKEKKK